MAQNSKNVNTSQNKTSILMIYYEFPGENCKATKRSCVKISG